MSNPNPVNLNNLDGRYAKPADVAAAVSAQAVTDAGQYLQQWKANTAYSSGQIVIAPDGSTVLTNTSFTTGPTYNASNWIVLSPTSTSIASQYPMLRSTAPDPATVTAYIDTSINPPVLKTWNGISWVSVTSAATSSVLRPGRDLGFARTLVGNNNIPIAVALRTAAGTGRSVHVAAYEMTDLQLTYTNFNSATIGTDTSGPNAYPIKAYIVYGGVNYTVTFNGQINGNVDPGGTLKSDRIGIDIPANATFEILTFINSTNWYSNKTAYSGTGNGGFSTGTDIATSVPDSVGYMYIPSLIEGTATDISALTVAGMGDSIMQGTGDGGNGADGGQISTGSGGGWLARALYKKRGYLMLAKGSERGDQFVAQSGHVRRLALANGSLWAICGYGRNDLSNAQALATVQTTLIAHWKLCSRRGMKVVQTTITPYTSSTDSWATTGNQTVQTSANESARVSLNTWLRAGAPVNTSLAAVTAGTSGALVAGNSGHPLNSIFDLTAIVESGVNSGLWAASSTNDGLHPNTASHISIATAFATTVTNTLTLSNYLTSS